MFWSPLLCCRAQATHPKAPLHTPGNHAEPGSVSSAAPCVSFSLRLYFIKLRSFLPSLRTHSSPVSKFWSSLLEVLEEMMGKQGLVNLKIIFNSASNSQGLQNALILCPRLPSDPFWAPARVQMLQLPEVWPGAATVATPWWTHLLTHSHSPKTSIC